MGSDEIKSKWSAYKRLLFLQNKQSSRRHFIETGFTRDSQDNVDQVNFF